MTFGYIWLWWSVVNCWAMLGSKNQSDPIGTKESNGPTAEPAPCWLASARSGNNSAQISPACPWSAVTRQAPVKCSETPWISGASARFKKGHCGKWEPLMFLDLILTTAVSNSVIISCCRSRKWWPQIWAPLVGVGLRRCHVKCAEAALDEAASALEPKFGQSLRELLKHSKMLKQQKAQCFFLMFFSQVVFNYFNIF